MTNYVVSRSQTLTKNYSPMFSLNTGDSLAVNSGIVLKHTGTGSPIATLKDNTNLEFGAKSQVTSKDTSFSSTGGNINVVLSLDAVVSSYTKYAFYFGGTHNSFINNGRIDAGGYLSGLDHIGLAAISSGGASYIHNYGSIGNLSTSNVGVILRSGGNEIINDRDEDGWIQGLKTAIDITGGNNKIMNGGKIASQTGPAIFLHTDGTNAGNTIVNAGSIRSSTGSAIVSDGNLADTVENGVNGRLEGKIELGGGNDFLMNYGYIAGAVSLGEGDDTFIIERTVDQPYYMGGSLYGDVYLDGGNDVFDNINGNHFASVFNTGPGRIYGGDGADTISGGIQAEIISGGLGNDILTSRAGRDAFLFDTALGPQNVDVITDFNINEDMIHLKASIFSKIVGPFNASHFCIGASAADSSDRIIYNRETGTLSYDPDGSGTASAAVCFAKLAQGLDLKAEYFLLV
jgi:Ca2+-binding RTX toxin-like protein